MLDHLLRRLTRFADLNNQDLERIKSCAWVTEHIAAGVDLIEEGTLRPRAQENVRHEAVCAF